LLIKFIIAPGYGESFVVTGRGIHQTTFLIQYMLPRFFLEGKWLKPFASKHFMHFLIALRFPDHFANLLQKRKRESSRHP
jgi:hypothetical protein